MKPSTPGSQQIFVTEIGPSYICQRTKESFDSSIKANFRVFQNHRKQAKIDIIFYCFSSLGHDFEFFKSFNFCP